jgi:hypothetical protein
MKCSMLRIQGRRGGGEEKKPAAASWLVPTSEGLILRVYIVQVTRLKFEILQTEKNYCMYLQNI